MDTGEPPERAAEVTCAEIPHAQSHVARWVRPRWRGSRIAARKIRCERMRHGFAVGTIEPAMRVMQTHELANQGRQPLNESARRTEAVLGALREFLYGASAVKSGEVDERAKSKPPQPQRSAQPSGVANTATSLSLRAPPSGAGKARPSTIGQPELRAAEHGARVNYLVLSTPTL